MSYAGGYNVYPGVDIIASPPLFFSYFQKHTHGCVFWIRILIQYYFNKWLLYSNFVYYVCMYNDNTLEGCQFLVPCEKKVMLGRSI